MGHIWIVRKLSEAFYYQLLEELVLPKKIGNGLLIIDGDQIQLKGMQYDDLLRSFAASGVQVLKLAASCSGIQQPDDVGPTFKNLHLALNQGKYAKEVDEKIVEDVRAKLEITELKGKVVKRVGILVERLQPTLSQVKQFFSSYF
jgi:hypothetical protein